MISRTALDDLTADYRTAARHVNHAATILDDASITMASINAATGWTSQRVITAINDLCAQLDAVTRLLDGVPADPA
jgi:inosine/xanthosine triphosphate pyrophosphatase family protein